MATEILILTVTVFLFVFAWVRNRPSLPKTYPNGPPGWPIIGNLLQLGTKPHLKLTEWSRQYGDVYSLTLSQKRVVVLNSFKALSEALIDRKSDFSGRPRDFITWNICTECKDIAFMDYGDIWKDLRKTTHTALRMNGTTRWKEIITREVNKLIETFSAKDGTPFDPHLPITMVAFNTVSELTQSQTYNENDPEFISFTEMTRKIFQNLGEASAVDFAWWLKPFFKSKLDILKEVTTQRYNYMAKKLEGRKTTLDRENPKDILEMLLLAKEEYQKNKGQDVAMEMEYNDEVVIHTVMDILLAGSETVVSSMLWLLIDVISHPEVQRKIHQEMDDVIGRGRRPEYSDHEKLHYLKAAMYESMRLHSIGPLSIFHRTVCPTSIREHRIPEDTIIIPNHWAVDHDPDVFTDPYVFRPERFIDADTGHCFSFSEMKFTPFGMGRRVCIGEMLARIEYFICAANVMHSFEVAVPDDQGNPSTDGILGLTYEPKPFKIIAKPRH